MALVNHAKKEINAKLVYYGPAGSGKSAALHYIYSRIKPSLRGELKNIPAGEDNLLFFDFSPFEVPMADGYRLRLHIYTLTGQVTNLATWKMTLKGADGLVIMVNPAPDRLLPARESLTELRDLLSAYGVGLQDIPAILQLAFSEKEACHNETTQIALALDLPRLPTCCSNVESGEGVLDALSTLSRLVLERVSGTEKPLAPTAECNVIAEEYDEYDEYGECEETVCKDVSAPTFAEEVPEVRCADSLPTMSIDQHGASIDGRLLRIPIDISCGDVCRKLVVTVSVDLL